MRTRPREVAASGRCRQVALTLCPLLFVFLPPLLPNLLPRMPRYCTVWRQPAYAAVFCGQAGRGRRGGSSARWRCAAATWRPIARANSLAGSDHLILQLLLLSACETIQPTQLCL